MSASPGLWLVIAVVGAGTFALRAAFLARGGAGEPSPRFERIVRHVPTAALTALVAAAVLSPPAGSGDVPLRVLALGVAAAIAVRTRSVVVTLLAGMLVLWLLQWAF